MLDQIGFSFLKRTVKNILGLRNKFCTFDS